MTIVRATNGGILLKRTYLVVRQGMDDEERMIPFTEALKSCLVLKEKFIGDSVVIETVGEELVVTFDNMVFKFPYREVFQEFI